VLLECIGRGGMAEVFRAVAQGVEGFQRVFVVKRIQREQSENPALVEMFANEARISALLNHPNIVQVFDFGQLDGSYFISMEYLRGKDLLAVLRQMRAVGRSFPPALAATIAREVARGLAYAHDLVAPGGKSLDIIHRDVSPSNIMLLRAGGVKLLDFGIAKASAVLQEGKKDGKGHTTGTGMVKGKLSYLSPEQVRHEPVDARSDIFSLGVVLWECLTGKRLFHDRSDYHTMNNVLTRPVPAPSTQQPDVPAELDAIVLRTLERDRKKRTQNAKTLADELDHFLADNRVSPRAVPHLLDDLFGADSHELEAVPAVSPAALATDAVTPVLTAVMLPTIPSITAITAVGSTPSRSDGSRSDGLLPASSSSGPRSVSGTTRVWPWVAGAVLLIAAFSAGRLVRPGIDESTQVQARPATVAVPAPVAVKPPTPAEAQPPKETLPATVSVRVESDPPGAEVVGPDGAVLGTTPLTTNLPRGNETVTFTLSKPGFSPSRQSITPDRDVAALVSLRTTPTAPARASDKVVKTARAAKPSGKARSAANTTASESTGEPPSGAAESPAPAAATETTEAEPKAAVVPPPAEAPASEPAPAAPAP
jgi:eukaryotic-like serine/threonine-protein kinase